MAAPRTRTRRVHPQLGCSRHFWKRLEGLSPEHLSLKQPLHAATLGPTDLPQLCRGDTASGGGGALSQRGMEDPPRCKEGFLGQIERSHSKPRLNASHMTGLLLPLLEGKGYSNAEGQHQWGWGGQRHTLHSASVDIKTSICPWVQRHKSDWFVQPCSGGQVVV